MSTKDVACRRSSKVEAFSIGCCYVAGESDRDHRDCDDCGRDHGYVQEILHDVHDGYGDHDDRVRDDDANDGHDHGHGRDDDDVNDLRNDHDSIPGSLLRLSMQSYKVLYVRFSTWKFKNEKFDYCFERISKYLCLKIFIKICY